MEIMEEYGEVALKYMNSMKSSMELNSQGMNVYRNGFDSFMILHAAEQYVLPLEIRELMRIGDIIKPYGNSLGLRLSTRICWSGVNNFFTIRSKPCSKCDTISRCGDRVWSLGDYQICGSCYGKTPAQWEFVQQTVMINLLDWVEFMTEPDMSSRFYVNCNPESYHYGRIMYGIPCNDYMGRSMTMFRDVGYTSDLLEKIRDWLNHVPGNFDANLNVQKCVDFLDSKSQYANFIDVCASHLTNRYFLTHPIRDDIEKMARESVRGVLMKYIQHEDLTYRSFANYLL